MRTRVLLFVTSVFVAPCAYGHADVPAGGATHAQAKSPKNTPRERLRAFRSERELRRFLRKRARVQARREVGVGAGMGVPAPSTKADISATPSAGDGIAGKAAEVPAGSPAESVTIVQHAGVDEGGIVKLHGNRLVVLRRGRLFTIDIGGGALRPVSALDDNCRASCVDWYGNARPLFLRGRVFALLGYELVEGARLR